MRRQIAIYRAVAYGIVGAAIGRPPTNCVAICWFSAGKQSVIAFWRCDFVLQNHPDERCSPLRRLTKLPDKREFEARKTPGSAFAEPGVA